MRLFSALAAAALMLASPVSADDISGTLKKIKDTGIIKLGYLSQSVPFSFAGEDGKAQGYSVELCERAARGIQEQLGLQKLDVQWIPVTLENRFDAVKTGKVDIECGITTNTLSRQKQVDFSVMTWIDGANFAVRDDSSAKSLADLAGKKIAVVSNTTTQTVLKDVLEKGYINAEVVLVHSHVEGLDKVFKGEVDAYSTDQVILIGLAASLPDTKKIKIGEKNFSYEPYGLMMRRNDADLRQAVNTVLARIYRTGQIKEIYNRWLGKLGKPGDLVIVMYLLNGLPE